MNVRYFLFSILISIPFFLTSCGDDDTVVEDSTINDGKTHIELSILYTPNGIGDRSYIDQIYTQAILIAEFAMMNDTVFAIASVKVKHLIPADDADAERLLTTWDQETTAKNEYRLMVLTSDYFTSLLADNSNWRKDDRSDVLMLDKRNANDADLYTINLLYYGPAWEAGYLSAQDESLKSSALLMANQTGQALIDLREGWLDGYEAGGGNRSDIEIFTTGSYDDELSAANISDSLFNLRGDRNINQVVCLMGGAQMGCLRMLERRYFQDTTGFFAKKRISVCEAEYGSCYNNFISFTLKKESGVAMSNWIDNWIQWRLGLESGEVPERETIFMLDDSTLYGGILLDIERGYNLGISDEERAQFYPLACEAEKKYMEKQ